jgi:hypothetical protein
MGSPQQTISPLYASTPSIEINQGTLQGDTLSLVLFALFLEPFLRWLTIGSRGYRPGAPTTNADPTKPTATYPGHGFADDLSLATGSPTNMTIRLQKLPLFSAYTCMIVNVRKCCITGALWRSGNALSLANRKLLASRMQKDSVNINSHTSLIPSIGPSDIYRVLGESGSNSTPHSPSPNIGMNSRAQQPPSSMPYPPPY